MDKIKPCPFCGQNPNINPPKPKRVMNITVNRNAFIECVNKDCIAVVYVEAPSLQECLERWNVRQDAAMECRDDQ
jgi:hypothetical protein